MSNYLAPYVNESGLHISSYQDTLDDLIEKYKEIYGQDIYLESDSADYQWLSVVALKLFNCAQAIQLAYNNRSPKTAMGSALDTLVKFNGITRLAATHSSCVVTITGTAGTVINNGIVTDVNGNKWDLPVIVTIPVGGTIDVTATAQELGAITALAGNLSIITTPTAGWISVTNAGAALTGQPVETDAELRARQATSVALPSSTLLQGTAAAIAAVDGVLRSKAYENYTAAIDANGMNPHSIGAVVEGGDETEIAEVIYDNRGIGCGMEGTTTVVVTDPITSQNVNVKFFRPTAVPIFITINVHPLAGYGASTADLIKFWVAAMINSRQIGDDVENSFLYWAAMTYPEGNPLNPAFSISSLVAGIEVGVQNANTIAIAYNAVAVGDVNNIVINEV
jgi:uncharacterized phage protein gp47/JayE